MDASANGLVPNRSTLGDANAKRSDSIFGDNSFMLKPANFDDGDVLAMDRAYIDYEKFEELTRRGVTYVTKMKKNLTYETVSESLLLDDGKFGKNPLRKSSFTRTARRTGPGSFRMLKPRHPEGDARSRKSSS